jgi:Family of unknown function (DUF5723)
MRFTFKTISFIAATILSFSLVAQEQLGLRLDNYSGVSGISINPASNGTAQLGWDVNLVGFGLFVNNSLGFIDGASVGKAASNAMNIGPADGLDIKKNPNATLRFDFYDNLNPKYFSLSTQVMGPSFVINLKSGHSFGLFTGARFMASSHDLPSIFNGYEFQKKKVGEMFAVDPFKVTGMAWREVGLNYAYRIGDETDGSLTLGASVRSVSAYQAFYANNLVGTSMARISKDSLRFDGLRAEFGATMDLTSADRQANTNGSGIGFDIGVTLTIPSSDEDKPYDWRLGASILDMGAVTMTTNTEVHRLEIKEPYQIMAQKFNNLDPNNQSRDALERLSRDITGNPNGTLKSNTFSMGMPTAISLQADYAIMKGVFVNGLLMQNIPVGEHVLLRDNLFAVTPRYESRWIGGSLPISIVNWKTTRVGLAARLAFLTIGTDDLGSIITNGKLTGTDFYFALKINPFKLGLSGGGSGSSRRGKAQECYRF